MFKKLDMIKLMLQELGGEMAELEAILQHEEAHWAIQFDDGTVVLMEWVDGPSRLILSASLGKVSAPMQMAVYETMLSYNLLWRETGGVKAALNGPEGELMLLFELHAEQLTVNMLKIVLENFAGLVHVWGTYVKTETGSRPLDALSTDAVHLRA
ncbi:MAG: hypothetical protein JWQ23_55 [Herminiimonas sp.]|nr:hypothetical protein [Herminiimonas sp.]